MGAELLGVYMSDHPFKQASVDLAPYLTAQLTEIGPDLAGAEAVVAGTVGTAPPASTRQGKTFAAFALEDLSGTVELTVWPDGYERYRELLIEGNVLLARIGVRQRSDRLTLAVEDLCGYDLDAGAPIGFDPARFRVKAPRRRAPEPALSVGDESAPYDFEAPRALGARRGQHRRTRPPAPRRLRAGPGSPRPARDPHRGAHRPSTPPHRDGRDHR